MVKILYGIQSCGKGHALRSKPIIEHLLANGHKVKIVTGVKEGDFLKKYFDDIETIHHFGFHFSDNEVSYSKTVLDSIMGIRSFFNDGVLKIRKIAEEYKPDLVISDFEVYSSKTAEFKNIPFISIENVNVLRVNKTPYTFDNFRYYMISRIFASLITTAPDHYFITSFYPLPLRNKKYLKKITLVKPILRKEIISARKKTRHSNSIIVYQSVNKVQGIIPALLDCFDQNFILYGCDEEKKLKNITFKKFDEKGFISDLAKCKAVITTGGYTLISESIYLGKPILCSPIKKHYEQYLNGYMIEKAGFGKSVPRVNATEIYRFLLKLEDYRKNLEGYSQSGNRDFFNKLDVKINELVKTKRKSVRSKITSLLLDPYE